MSSHTKNASVSSKCTTFSDIMNALDQSYDRIRSMGADEIQRERVDSANSLAAREAKVNDRRTAFDQKKYLVHLASGEISLTQIQVAANARKLPEEHIADYLRINGKLQDPWFGTGRCTYAPYPLPPKRKRDALSDNIDDALKKVKNLFEK